MNYKLLIYQKTPFENILGYLQMNGFVVDLANDNNIVSKVEARDYDACILDACSYEDRYALINKVRTLSRNVAIIFMAKDECENDAVNCFNCGADDYIRMPYDIKELICRLNAVLKRSGKSSFGSEHQIGDYIFNPKERTLSINGKETKLTERESKLLLMLSEYRNTIMPRKIALKAIWLDDNVFNGRSMDVYITKLRKYLSEDKRISITSIRSQGFALVIE